MTNRPVPALACAAPNGVRVRSATAVLAVAALLAACASGPKAPSARSGPAPSHERDGPDARPPSGLDKVPDAVPRVEPLRVGGPNKPYVVLGQAYKPHASDVRLVEKGLASWYGKKFHGRRTSNGEVYDMYAMTAAHKTMPLPSYARVRNPKNGREIIVRVNDRGPFHKGRIIDLSYTAALKLGVLQGVAPVEVERLTHDDIRTGAWQRGGTHVALAPPQEPPPAPEAPPAAPVEDGPPAVAYTAASEGFWVQLGAFQQRGGADQFQHRVARELEWLSPLLAVFSETSVFRLQAGPYPSRDEAQAVAQRVRDSLKLVPVVVQRR